MVYIHCSVRVSFEDKLKVLLITGLDFCIYGLDLEYEQIIRRTFFTSRVWSGSTLYIPDSKLCFKEEIYVTLVIVKEFEYEQ